MKFVKTRTKALKSYNQTVLRALARGFQITDESKTSNIHREHALDSYSHLEQFPISFISEYELHYLKLQGFHFVTKWMP